MNQIPKNVKSEYTQIKRNTGGGLQTESLRRNKTMGEKTKSSKEVAELEVVKLGSMHFEEKVGILEQLIGKNVEVYWRDKRKHGRFISIFDDHIVLINKLAKEVDYQSVYETEVIDISKINFLVV